jgi:hypothetical protein
MKENHLVEPKAEYEMALDLTGPRSGRLIRERGVKGDGLSSPRSAGSGQELSRGVALRNLTREPSVRLRNHDEADRAESIEFRLKFRKDRTRRMEDELSIGELEHRHANRDWNHPDPPTELVLGAPEIRVVPN